MEFFAEPKPITRDLLGFFSKDHFFLLGQSIPIKLGNIKKYPDVSLLKKEELLRIVQIKLYLTSGIKEINKEYNDFEQMKIKFNNLKCLLLVFGLVPRSEKIRNRIAELNRGNNGFRSIILDEFIAPIAKELLSWFDLDAILY